MMEICCALHNFRVRLTPYFCLHGSGFLHSMTHLKVESENACHTPGCRCRRLCFL